MSKPKRRIRTAAIAFAAVAGLLVAGCADTGTDDLTAENYYEGKVIEIVVPFGPGGGSEYLSSLVARHLPDHIAGSPEIRVTFEEGAGGITGTNNFILSRPHDGYSLVYYTMSNSIPVTLGQSALRYTHDDFEPLIAFPQGSVVFVNSNTGVSDVQGLQNPSAQLVNALRSVTGYDLLQVLALEVLGIREDVLQIFGYSGGGAQRIAFETGEANMVMMSPFGFNEQYGADEDAGIVNRLFTYPVLQADGSLGKDPVFDELPTLNEAYFELYGSEPSGEAWDAFVALLVSSTFNRFAVHSDAPEAAREALRAGFESMAATNAFRTDLQALVGPYLPLVGADLSAVTNGIENIDDSVVNWLQEFVTTEYDVVLN